MITGTILIAALVGAVSYGVTYAVDRRKRPALVAGGLGSVLALVALWVL